MADLAENVAAVNANQDPKKIKVSWKKRIFSKYLLVVILGFLLGGFHSLYVSKLFEADRNFSLLSPLEREMSLKTEMGFYYSYYKTIVEERPLILGLSKIMYDRIVEYPKEINAINRFNIHPEVVIGALFNYLEPYLNNTVECYRLDRGELPEVDTCVGLGVPIYFYLEVIWIFSGLTIAMLFFISASLCGTPSAGLLCILFYMCNHMDATRVMWTPNERENFAQPFLLTQMFFLTLQLKRSKEQLGGLWLQFAIVLLNCICLLCWQFTQFIFLTQIVVLYFMEQLKLISTRAFCVYLHGHFCGIHIAMLLLQGNDMLKTSLYVCVFTVLSIYALIFSYFRIKVRTRKDLILECLFIVIRAFLLIKISIWLKKFANDMFETDEDSHVFDIFFSKLGLVTSFHTMMYTCAPVFDFMPYATWVRLTNNGLLPLVGIVLVNVFVYYNHFGKSAADEYISKKIANIENETENYNDNVNKPDENSVEKEKDEASEDLINTKNEKSPKDADEVKISKDSLNADETTKDSKAVETPKGDEKSEDANRVENEKDPASATETSKATKSAETPKDTKSAEKSKDDKAVEAPKDADSAKQSKDAKATESLKDAEAADTPKYDKSAENTKDANLAETPKDAITAAISTDTKSTQTPNDDKSAENTKDAKALQEAKEAKAAKKAKKAKAKQNKKNEQELDKIVVYFKNLHIDSALFYHFAQMAAFGLMAALVMRLKLLFVPHLCIVAACSCVCVYYTRYSRRRQVMTGIIVTILVGMAMYKTRINVKQEMSYVGQYSDVYLEELLKWISEDTSATAVFAGPMPVTAVVMLTTRRAIVNHPHYENADARHRNYIVYKMYGRFPPQQYHDELSKLKVSHLIIDKTYCYGQSTKGCSFSNIWDLEYPSLKDQPLLCEKLISGELKNFYVIFNNPMYAVLWVHDYSIKYNPKLLNT